jgi:hypothetical protein
MGGICPNIFSIAPKLKLAVADVKFKASGPIPLVQAGS